MTQPQRKWLPFLDWFGIWPGAAAYEADGRAWVSEAPQGVQLPVRGEPMLIADRPWESALGYATAFYLVFNKSIEGCVFRDPSADAAERYKKWRSSLCCRTAASICPLSA